jgi:hypothetical protein
MKAVRTVEEKEATLKQRQDEQRSLGKQIDKLIAEGQVNHDAVSMGCGGRGFFPSMCRGISRFLGISHRVGAVSTKEVEVAACAPASARMASKKVASGGDISRAVLGLAASKKKTPQSKLAAAAEAMKARVESLDARAAECRSAAQKQMQAANKAAAMRELKRSKALEKQAVLTQGAMDALEAQSDMLEQTVLQKEVAAALGATAASLKKEKGLLTKAEDAVDAAHEMRDMHEDLTQVMSGLGDVASADFDDDDLMQELEQMVGGDESGESTASAAAAVEAERLALQRQQAELDARRMRYEELEAQRQKFPTAPKNPVAVEKQGLLAQ